jgi:hypothetical protein
LYDRTAVWKFLGLFTTAWGLPSGPVAGLTRLPTGWIRLPVALSETYACSGLLHHTGLDR